ncbi:TetR family transcriptional regulator [Nocardia salmonicida]|uniref:TetR family transcriptional regulator n=1 Tax=Nocardia salmonicida TaxID=53431 RepID=UPI002E2C54D5|nr:TetR family transcriptional regulator [Nocardia salmonicida]
MNSGTEARRRAAETKRQRTREALVEAARTRFDVAGWHGTRVEDIAADAGVGSATAFNHFNKQTLLGYAFAPLIEPLVLQAAADVAAGEPPTLALSRHVRALAQVGRRHQHLTTALLYAVIEQASTTAGPPNPDDPDDLRNIVPLPAPMSELIEYGQAAGEFCSLVASTEVAIYHTNALLLRVLLRPKESAKDTAESILAQLLPPLLQVGQ